ncbi:MAG TPA: hypothetical protein VFE58_03155 [Tepidisphaeraceae bacterium]|jgi:cell division protein FtsL|nr:hypothetical protein [Tepidisphaeraceae bacterium]
MLKLLTCLCAAIAIGVAMLQTRQQHLEINYQINKLHNQIESQQSKLWSQQLQIAVYAGTPTVAKSLQANAIKMVPSTPLESQDSANDRPAFTAMAR